MTTIKDRPADPASCPVVPLASRSRRADQRQYPTPEQVAAVLAWGHDPIAPFPQSLLDQKRAARFARILEQESALRAAMPPIPESVYARCLLDNGCTPETMDRIGESGLAAAMRALVPRPRHLRSVGGGAS
jgi:hypothetical protein